MIASSRRPPVPSSPMMNWATNQVTTLAAIPARPPSSTGRRRARRVPTNEAVIAARIRTASRPSRKTRIAASVTTVARLTSTSPSACWALVSASPARRAAAATVAAPAWRGQGDEQTRRRRATSTTAPRVSVPALRAQAPGQRRRRRLSAQRGGDRGSRGRRPAPRRTAAFKVCADRVVGAPRRDPRLAVRPAEGGGGQACDVGDGRPRLQRVARRVRARPQAGQRRARRPAVAARRGARPRCAAAPAAAVVVNGDRLACTGPGSVSSSGDAARGGRGQASGRAASDRDRRA